MDFLSFNVNEIADKLKAGQITICVIGIGRIGLPTALIFAQAGAKVIGADISENIVENINSGITHVDEPGIEEILKSAISSGNFQASTDVSGSIYEADVIIICVPTPVDVNKNPDYSALMAVSQDLVKGLKKGSLIIVESTIAPGVVEEAIVPFIEEHTNFAVAKDLGVVSCPERADPGKILECLKTVPRIVGGIDERSGDLAAALYNAAMGVKIVKVSNPRTANAVKLTENIFRDVNIALINELAILYEKIGINIIETLGAASTKWNFVPHYPGPGVGGPCLPANPYYLIQVANKVGYIPYLVRLAREINDRMPDNVVHLILEALNGIGKPIKGSKIAILGITYKPGIKDIQNAPAERIINALMSLGTQITCYDPFFENEIAFGIPIEESVEVAIQNVDAILFCTAHAEFKQLNLENLSKYVRHPTVIIDTRNLFDLNKAKHAGFAYRGLGIPVSQEK
ncbi:MAG: nucleotide sugar dehydrogenase [Promethearchaeota archaeon]